MAVKTLARTVALVAAALLLSAVLAAERAPLSLSKALQLPADWAKSYSPPEVLIQVKTMPDSTFKLVSILDGKTELDSLLVAYLRSFTFSTSSDSLGIGQEFDVLVELQKAPSPPESVMALQDRSMLLSEIEGWITLDRRSYNIRETARQTADSVLTGLPVPYRAGFFSYQRLADEIPFAVNGFQPHGSLYSTALQENYCQGILARQDDALAFSWEEKPYPYEAALSDIEVGLGDYEHRFARGAVKKNRLFGKNRMYLGFDFLAQGGYWLEENSSLSIIKLFLSAPLGKTMLDLGFGDYASKMSMSVLLPEYWQKENFSVERRYRAIQTAWRSPWLNLALLNENDTSRAQKFVHALHNDALHLQAWKSVNIGALKVKALYEHQITERDFELGKKDYQDLAGLRLDYSDALYKGALQADLYDFEHGSAAADLSRSLHRFDLGTAARFSYNDPASRLWVPSIYTAGDSLRRVDIREKSNVALYLRYRVGQDSKLFLSAGRKEIQNSSVPDTTFTSLTALAAMPQKMLYVAASGDVSQNWGKWSLNWKPQISWEQDAFLFEEPRLEYSSALTLSRDLGYGNALFVGCSLLGHGGYSSATQDYFYVDDSLIADVWAGVRITERFEFQATYKNVTDSSIYGVYPLPPSLHASLRWYFLN